MADQKEKAAKKSGTPAGIKDSLKKATTEMLILSMLLKKPMYTYEMMREIEQTSNGILVYNTLYLAIYRLKDHGFITESHKELSEDNHMRVYFAITEDGRIYYKSIYEEYRQMIKTLDQMLLNPNDGQ